jgi:hypothetical protein
MWWMLSLKPLIRDFYGGNCGGWGGALRQKIVLIRTRALCRRIRVNPKTYPQATSYKLHYVKSICGYQQHIHDGSARFDDIDGGLWTKAKKPCGQVMI